MSYTYEHPRPALTVDCVVFGLDETGLKVLLIKRARQPYLGRWALPGGYVEEDEDLDTAARRELLEETGLHLGTRRSRKAPGSGYLEQLYTFGKVNRDPRCRVVTVAYYALVKLSDHRVKAATDAAEARWFTVRGLPSLAFDHREIFDTALARLKAKVRYQPVGFALLPPKFSLTQLQRMYEVILERPLDKRNFRKKVLALGILEELPELEEGVRHRAARLYAFDREAYEERTLTGMNFEI
ncbi:MAG: NUDIX hydrolase [Acidobacteria bacterium]|nr:NUDIX hydrolase [Acidobacteriota bacterium]